MALDVDNPRGELVRDPYENKRKHLEWRVARVLTVRGRGTTHELAGPDRDAILRYVEDMEHGLNVSPSSKKGRRGYNHLITLRTRMSKLAWMLRERTGKQLTDLGEREVVAFFNDMRSGVLLRSDGRRYRCTRDYVKIFKAFWHWHMRVKHHEGVEIPDITTSLDSSYDEKPAFVYFTFEELKRLCADANRRMRTMMWFMFDAGIRSPTELANVKGKDGCRAPSDLPPLVASRESFLYRLPNTSQTSSELLVRDRQRESRHDFGQVERFDVAAQSISANRKACDRNDA